MLRNEPPSNGFEMVWRRFSWQLQTLIICSILLVIVVLSVLVGVAKMEECTRVHPEWYCILSD